MPGRESHRAGRSGRVSPSRLGGRGRHRAPRRQGGRKPSPGRRGADEAAATAGPRGVGTISGRPAASEKPGRGASAQITAARRHGRGLPPSARPAATPAAVRPTPTPATKSKQSRSHSQPQAPRRRLRSPAPPTAEAEPRLRNNGAFSQAPRQQDAQLAADTVIASLAQRSRRIPRFWHCRHGAGA